MRNEFKTYGQAHYRAILSTREVQLMRHLREVDHWSYDKLAVKFDVTKSCVQMICTYQRRALG